jgi:hypothetical protein
MLAHLQLMSSPSATIKIAFAMLTVDTFRFSTAAVLFIGGTSFAAFRHRLQPDTRHHITEQL